MTFDEVLDLLLGQNLDDEVVSLVIYVMDTLKDTYAPTVEMVTSEYVYFRSFRFSDRSFVDFYQAISNQSDMIKFGLKQTPVYFVDLSENELMQAWLHPETIKVVDE